MGPLFMFKMYDQDEPADVKEILLNWNGNDKSVSWCPECTKEFDYYASIDTHKSFTPPFFLLHICIFRLT